MSTAVTSYPCTSTRHWYPVYIAKLWLLIVYLLLRVLFFYCLFVFFLLWLLGRACNETLVYTCCLQSMCKIQPGSNGSTWNPKQFYLEPKRVILWGQPKNAFGTLFSMSVLTKKHFWKGESPVAYREEERESIMVFILAASLPSLGLPIMGLLSMHTIRKGLNDWKRWSCRELDCINGTSECVFSLRPN